MCRKTTGFICSFLLLFAPMTMAAENPWADLQRQFLSADKKPKPKAVLPAAGKTVLVSKNEEDPWALLRAVYLPFSESDESKAATDKGAAKRVSNGISKRLKKYERIIAEASETFHVPRAIIAAVIMVESGGNEKAAAETTSAKGLMQTVSGTFREAREGLAAMGIHIADDPFDPRASVMAGTWYLDDMYKKAVRDDNIGAPNRENLNTWKSPLEYYYAGPGNGKKKADRIIIYSNGKKRVVDKSAYSRKVLRWAGTLDLKQ